MTALENIKNMDTADLKEFALEKGYSVAVNEINPNWTYDIEDINQGWKYSGVNFTVMAAVLML